MNAAAAVRTCCASLDMQGALAPDAAASLFMQSDEQPACRWCATCARRMLSLRLVDLCSLSGWQDTGAPGTADAEVPPFTCLAAGRLQAQMMQGLVTAGSTRPAFARQWSLRGQDTARVVMMLPVAGKGSGMRLSATAGTRLACDTHELI